MESKIKYLNLGVLAFQTMDLAQQNMDQSKNIEKNIFDNFWTKVKIKHRMEGLKITSKIFNERWMELKYK